MLSSPPDLAQVRLDNALRLFEEFVRATARHADAATLRGLERRFAERLEIQPSYWSQIKSRSRQIGERLARQFEQLCHKPAGWMDVPHDSPPGVHATGPGAAAGASDAPALRSQMAAASPAGAADRPDDRLPLDDDERFIVGLVLTYYRRHPQRARTRLLDLLGEVLIPASATAGSASARPAAPTAAGARPAGSPGSPGSATPATTAGPAEDARALWQRVQAGVAPLRKKR